ncbi:hypothetical protein SCUCBS95973_008997 [Sporothrix curviconia]|uniref:FAD-dependent oxidoreductase 2 FAD-binding domain-containing protein n=1 Tax=Sporothrix curviconia TaxID=1260050 RepID=A0ABP0CR95_9PEZI
MESLTVDVLVCGGGMSGLACASFAARAGAKVLVVEKQAAVGGSSNYSAGMFWAPQNYDKLRAWVPDGDPALQKAFLDEYLPSVQWMRENGVPTAPRFDGIMSIGIGFPITIRSLQGLQRGWIDAAGNGSQIWTGASLVKLNQKQPGVTGARVTGAVVRRGSQLYNVRAAAVVLATGGFQGSPSLVSRHLGPGADNILVRANRGSVGDGLRLAAEVGASTSRGMSTYYGHLMAAPLRVEDVDPKDFLSLAQYQSKYCLLLNEGGRRFADETTGDEIVNQYLARQEKRRGFLLFNEKTRVQHCVTALFPNAGDIDRLQKAAAHGCRVQSASTLAGLLEILGAWGVNAAQARQTIDDYDRAVRQGDRSIALDAPVGRGPSPPPVTLVDGDGPFYAMEVQPSITFTYGGIAIDTQGHALTADKTRIPGLLVSGVDAGGFSNTGYTGGLSLAFVTGLWAAREVARELSLPEPKLPASDAGDAKVAATGVKL